MTEAERMAAEWACERLIRRFTLLNDRKEADALADLFTEDGVFARPTDPGNPVVGRAAIRAFFATRPRNRLTRHLCTNTVIDVEGPDAARGISYVLLYTGLAADPPGDGPVPADAAQLVGEFRDRFVRIDGEWRIAERLGSLTFTATGG